MEQSFDDDKDNDDIIDNTSNIVLGQLRTWQNYRLPVGLSEYQLCILDCYISNRHYLIDGAQLDNVSNPCDRDVSWHPQYHVEYT